MMKPEWLILIGFAPMILGPLQSGGDSITAQLCSGGVIQIPIDGEQPDQAPEQPCFKACHAGTCRKRSDKGTTPGDLDLDLE